MVIKNLAEPPPTKNWKEKIKDIMGMLAGIAVIISLFLMVKFITNG